MIRADFFFKGKEISIRNDFDDQVTGCVTHLFGFYQAMMEGLFVGKGKERKQHECEAIHHRSKI